MPMLDDTAPAGDAKLPTQLNTTVHNVIHPGVAAGVPESAQEEQELIKRIAGRDSHALGLLYDRYAALIYALALRITGREEAAEIVVKEVFARCWQATTQVLHGDVAVCLIALTRQYAHQLGDASHGLPAPYAAHSTRTLDLPPQHLTSDRAVTDRVRAALALVPDDQRTVIDLAYYAGLRVPAIAVRLGLPPQVVLRLLRIGICTLSVHLHTREEN
jgi:RNA polymerase sigma-70 factor (ECF subfamily)